MDKRIFIALYLCVITMPAFSADSMRLNATYKAYWKAFMVYRADVSATLGEDHYEALVRSGTRGVLRWFSPSDNVTTVSGQISGLGPVQPHIYETSGRWGGQAYAQKILFDEAGSEVAYHMDWPDKWLTEFPREEVPLSMKKAPDPFSASIPIFLKGPPAIDSGVSVTAYAGRIVMVLHLGCADGQEDLPRVSKAATFGNATRCMLDGRLLAGHRILTEEEKAELEKKQKDKDQGDEEPTLVWFQPFLEDRLHVPVQMRFDSSMGDIAMYLTRLEINGETVASR